VYHGILQIAIPLLYGEFGLMPYRKPLTLVFGKPLKFAQKAEPTKEDIDSAHAAYCSALLKLFDGYKGKLGYNDAKLEIV
jgi:2-acylglycerol O-acyltransferase 2